MSNAAVLVAPGLLKSGAVVELDDDEVHHLHVRRVPDDAMVRVFDGEGTVAVGQVRRRGNSVVATISDARSAARPPTTILAVGAGDKDRFLPLAERATELGVTRLVPIETGRSRDVGGRIRVEQIERMRRRAREACKQCGSPWAAVVGEPIPLAALGETHGGARWLLADVGGAVAPQIGAKTPIGWIIGPEGGLTAEEIAWCSDALGATLAVLGPSMLRFDTAAIAAAAVTIDRRHTALEG
ncbi:MAG TPA: RsmE family RNA methyltransferase [Gemmatimonadales bacterium]|jgi:16S rRNA (uracil1498-N3)-methyltransferase